jgi:hypothetical protein
LTSTTAPMICAISPELMLSSSLPKLNSESC